VSSTVEEKLMRSTIAVTSAYLVAAFTTPLLVPTSNGVLKDRAAMLIYDGRDRVLARLPFRDTANMALIVLVQMEGDRVARSQLANRPCIGVALFSNYEWAALATIGRKPEDVRPSDAAMRLRIYPATEKMHAAVENIQERRAYVAVGLEAMKDPRARVPLTWSVQTHLDSARGRCTVE
jgi:hypothetical protein